MSGVALAEKPAGNASSSAPSKLHDSVVAVVTPYEPALSETFIRAHVERLRTLLARIGSKALIRPTSPDALDFATSTAPSAWSPTVDPATPAMLMYTSGTTGVPKGALLSHGNMLHAGRTVTESLALSQQDRVLSSLPEGATEFWSA